MILRTGCCFATVSCGFSSRRCPCLLARVRLTPLYRCSFTIPPAPTGVHVSDLRLSLLAMRGGCLMPLVLIICCVVANSDPFSSAPPGLSASPESSAPAQNYRVVGAVLLGELAAAVIRSSDGRFRVVHPGENLGDAVVVKITLDEVHLQVGADVLRLAVE